MSNPTPQQQQEEPMTLQWAANIFAIMANQFSDTPKGHHNIARAYALLSDLAKQSEQASATKGAS
jgi:hypothetical protein